ncbi:hypothetical protein HPB47_012519 [Ixodes persulcatus]|uniref:Uncharacterized protein n=1 Tax=Ixodes persulcatus TaxID=34615 RepID=A0AC60NTA3_IXOPE|nr:hypothetical protein HPB47_012519 [Ixodes persulcatus]
MAKFKELKGDFKEEREIRAMLETQVKELNDQLRQEREKRAELENLGKGNWNLATHNEEGEKQLRIKTSGMVHIVACTVPEVRGREVDTSRASLLPQASLAPLAEPERGRSGGRLSTTKRQESRAWQRQSRGRQRRRPDGTRRHLPELVYSFGNQMAPSLYYRGSEYRTGKYSGHVDVWTIPRQSPVHKPALQEDNRLARVVIAPDYVEKESCLRCPKDQTIFVEPGFSCTQVPKPKLRPCARWTSFPDKVAMTATLGPQPGSLVMEGVYVMRFTFQAGAMLPQSCQYQLRVKVLRCPPLTAPDNGGLRCSQGRHWGSRCRFFCQRGFSLSERSVTRCVIKGRRKATWTPHPAPRCSGPPNVPNSAAGPEALEAVGLPMAQEPRRSLAAL